MNNFIKIGMPVLVVIFLLVAAISITFTVTKENTLKQVAAAANTPLSNIEAQLARSPQTPNYAVNGQPAVSIPGQSAISVPENDSNYSTDAALPSCHASGTQVTGTTTGYISSGGCGSGKCGGCTGQPSSSSAGSTSGASCH